MLRGGAKRLARGCLHRQLYLALRSSTLVSVAVYPGTLRWLSTRSGVGVCDEPLRWEKMGLFQGWYIAAIFHSVSDCFVMGGDAGDAAACTCTSVIGSMRYTGVYGDTHARSAALQIVSQLTQRLDMQSRVDSVSAAAHAGCCSSAVRFRAA